MQEVEFSFEPTRKGIEEFLLKYSSPTSLSPIAKPMEKFHTIISVDSGSEAESTIYELMKQREWKGTFQVVSNDSNEHIEAMASSDFGISYDGQIVGQAVACHLPTMVLFNMRKHHQWYHDSFNRWVNDMNLVADNNIYPELIGGEAWYGKITDTLGNWYINPSKRYEYIIKWEHLIKEALPKFSGEQPGEKMFGEIIYSDGNSYEEFSDPIFLTTQKVWENIKSFGETEFESSHNVRRRAMKSTFDFSR